MILPHDPRENDPSPRQDPEVAAADQKKARAAEGVAWTPFDPGDAPELPGSVDGAGRVVAMIASTELVGAGWATAVASELARVWASQRPGIVLVDTDLARPRLHHAVRVDNAVGLAEVLRGEAPVADATRVVEEDRLFCVPAGNAPEDPAQGFDPTRWARLCKAFSDAGVTVAAYVPVQATWIDHVLETATDVVLLTEQDRRLEWPNREGAPPLRAVLGPMPLKRPPTDPTGKLRTSSPLLGFDPPVVDPGKEAGDFPAEDPVAEVTMGPPPPGRALVPRKVRKDARLQRGRRRMAVGAVLVVSAVAAWAVSRMGDDTASAGEPAVAEDAIGSDTGLEAPPPAARPVPPDADFSVGVASYSEATRAEERASQLADAFPSLPWMVAPVEVEGTVYHRVVGGLVADSSAAAALGAELQRGGLTDWLVRGSGWVVELSVDSTRGRAEDRLAMARQAGIPAYLARIQLTDGSELWAVHAGAFRNHGEAEYLLRQSRQAGLQAMVTPRMGRPPS